jgi:OOP family OmpA-OmpF porin
VFDGIDQNPSRRRRKWTPGLPARSGRGNCERGSTNVRCARWGAVDRQDADRYRPRHVWDGIDKCPDTPLGAVVDANGCPVDSDGDRVPDGIDRCPDTPAGAPVDAYGCPADTDHDGVGDGFDKCPNTPPGTKVDADGCPPANDTDGDGVVDPNDRCPNTPKGSRVDEHGCLLLFEAVAPAVAGAAAATSRPTLILTGVNFETGRSVLTAASYAVLDQVSASLVANPEIRIEIAGYTDSTGSRPMNLRLSMGRAAAVRAYLARRGVSPLRMRAQGYGASGYIAPNATPEGRAKNRRVELHKLN